MYFFLNDASEPAAADQFFPKLLHMLPTSMTSATMTKRDMQTLSATHSNQQGPRSKQQAPTPSRQQQAATGSNKQERQQGNKQQAT